MEAGSIKQRRGSRAPPYPTNTVITRYRRQTAVLQPFGIEPQAGAGRGCLASEGPCLQLIFRLKAAQNQLSADPPRCALSKPEEGRRVRFCLRCAGQNRPRLGTARPSFPAGRGENWGSLALCASFPCGLPHPFVTSGLGRPLRLTVSRRFNKRRDPCAVPSRGLASPTPLLCALRHLPDPLSQGADKVGRKRPAFFCLPW
jgi:hypothetical protein